MKTSEKQRAIIKFVMPLHDKSFIGKEVIILGEYPYSAGVDVECQIGNGRYIFQKEQLEYDTVNDLVSDFETLSKWVAENPEADTSEFAKSNGLRFGDKTYENSSEERKERYTF